MPFFINYLRRSRRHNISAFCIVHIGLLQLLMLQNSQYYIYAFSPVSHPDSLDWKDISTQQIVERVTRNVKNGSIILFHNNAEHVLEYLPLILTSLKENGYEIVKINDMIYHENFHIDERGCQISDNGKVD